MHRPRQYTQIANVPRAKFSALLSEGLVALAEHTMTVASSAERCYEIGDAVAGDILVSVAREEAGKFLILLDTARIDRQDQAARSSQLKRAGDHLAKSLYFEMSDRSPATFSEVDHYFAKARKSHYLDGPNDFKWTFRNRSLADREDAMYVDYQETDDGYGWCNPADRSLGPPVRGQRVFDLVQALAASGFTSEAGLKVVTELWSDFVPSGGTNGSADTHWSEIETRNRTTLDGIRSIGFGVEADAEARIVASWTFPLHSIELSKLDTAKTIAEEKRRAARAALWDINDHAAIAVDNWGNGPADFARDLLDSVPAEDLDHEAEVARMKADYVREERQRFIESD